MNYLSTSFCTKVIERFSSSPFPERQITKVVLVRHGCSTYNDQGRYQGCSDESVLTEKGRQAAYQTGLALKNFDFEAVYNSPLKRVRQTTSEIIDAISKYRDRLPSVSIDNRLTEIDLSCWQGLSYQYVKENLAEDYLRWKQTPHLFSFSVNQSDRSFFPVKELYQQATLFWQEILTKHRGQTILVVAHSGTNRALISTAIGLTLDRYHTLQQSNCGISLLEFSAKETLKGKLQWLNLTHHLGETLPKLKEGKQGWRWLLISNRTSEHNWLKEYLHQESIDLILSDNSEYSEALAQNWDNYPSNSLHLSFDSHNFLEGWPQTILSQQKTNNTHFSLPLTTGLIIVQDNLLNNILTKIFNIQSSLATNTNLSVIHYPQVNHPPILQGSLPIGKVLEYCVAK